MVKKIISGGQTGADQAGLDVARELGIPHGGFCPKDRLCENGRIPDYYTLKETSTVDYVARTKLNIAHSDGTVIFQLGPLLGRGSRRTVKECLASDAPYFRVNLKSPNIVTEKDNFKAWIEDYAVEVLNVAGSRESKSPGIYEATCDFLRETLL